MSRDRGPDELGLASCKLCHKAMQAQATRLSYGQHYQCSTCKVTWVWTGTEWMPCESPELHVVVAGSYK